ncbi:MAG: double-strand break repair helicase AddA [Hyphomicrobiales bacterium]|nr:double-strand break repair helicase AddA [Hyphomicrobiales bacterium]MCP5370396.1 double-strand break repair helicase AddA [Hyphomicrobiales bacterium]
MSAPGGLDTLLRRQVEAADPATSVWFAANAGAGKTRVLVDRVLRLLLAGTRPARILCLTFTKAAAAEMANRLADHLGHWAAMDDDALTRDLEKLTGAAPEPGTLITARRLFAETLEVPGGLKIHTIHAFCESLLGRFPLEAGVAPHFSVIDERTAAELRREARDRLLTRAFGRGGEDIQAALSLLAGLIDEESLDRTMGDLDRHRGRLARMMARHGGVPGLVARAGGALGLAPGEDRAALLARARDGDHAGLLRAFAALDRGTATDAARAAALRAWLEGGGDFQADCVPIFLTAAGEPRKRLATKGVESADPGAVDILLAEQERVMTVVEKLHAVAIVEATGALLTLGAGLLDLYRELKQARALMDYDDLIDGARRLLERDGGVSWVLYKLDGGLDHILLDEAQDTSPDQWRVVAALAEEFFAGEGARDEARTLFVVGDEKQSIYSFQGADPDRFDDMRAHFAARAKAAGRPWRAVDMPLSFRSGWTVLGAVDRVFDDPAARDGLGAGAGPIRHFAYRDGAAGRVELWPVETPAEEEDRDPWDAPLDQVPAESPQARLAKRIAGQIRRWLDDGEVLPAAGRPMEPGDIMILLRRRGAFAEQMVRALKDANIPVAGSDRMVLTEQLAVMDLLALGRFVLLPEDDLTLAEVLKGPLFGLTDDDLLALAWNRGGRTLWSVLRDADDPRHRAAADRLGGLLARADYAPPFEFYAGLLGRDGGRRAVLGRLGQDAADPIDEFLGLALQYEREHVPSLQGFLAWIEASETEVKRDLEQSRGVVRVMTVHGSKGLQANVVFLPDTCAAPDTRLDSKLYWDEADDVAVWVPHRDGAVARTEALREDARARALREYRRLLYVAMTRARDRLYVCGWEGARGRAEGCWYDLVAPAVQDNGTEVELPGGGTGWRLEHPQTAAVEPAEAVSAAAAAPPPPAWIATPPPPEPEPSRPLAPSRPEDEPPVRAPFGADDGLRFRRGRLVHRLLQHLPDMAPESRPAAARAFLARPAHGLGPDEVEATAAEVLAVLDHPDFADLFGPAGRAEVPLVGDIGGVVVSGQVDRLLVTDDTVTIVDFKTNRPPPREVAAVPVVYLRQMATYGEALGRIYPGRRVRCLLLWTDGPRLMELPRSVLTSHAPGAGLGPARPA